MWALAHAGLGWTIGVASPTSDRRLRTACAAAALLPELGALAILGGRGTYDRFHVAAGHNIFVGLLAVAGAAWFFRRHPDRAWVAAIFLVALTVAVHFLADMKVWGSEIFLFWPLDRRGRRFETFVWQGSPLLVILGWILIGLPWALAFWKGVTPLEMFSPALDTLFLNLFRWKKHDCTSCGKKCNNRCRGCTRPVCFRHGKIGWHFRVTCPSCAAGSAPKVVGGGVEDYLARELQFFRGKEAMRLDPEFASFLHRKLTDGLRRLDDVPRTHPLWEGSDGRPTLAKLVDLSRAVLKDAPDDLESRWVLFADRVLACSPDLEYAAIEPAILNDFSAIRWLAAGARWSYVFSGTDPVVSLRGSFERLGKGVGSLEDLLLQLKTDKDAGTSQAACHCLELLHGKNPFKA